MLGRASWLRVVSHPLSGAFSPLYHPMEALSAQTRVLELLTCKSETINLVHQVGLLLEDCIPNSSVWILKTDDTDNVVRAIYAPLRHTPGGSSDQPPSVSAAQLWALVNKLGSDTSIPDVANHKSCADISAILKDPIPSSLLSLRIRPSNHHAWGCICLALHNTTSLDTDALEVLADAELWVKFAATIIERRILEERLQTVETRLDLAMKAGGIGIFDWEIPTGNLHWTPQQFEIYGLNPATFTPSYDAWRVKVFPEDMDRIEETLSSTFRNRERYFEGRHRTRNAKGETRWIRSLGEVIYNARGTPLRMVGTAQDITQELRAQEQISLDRRRLELVLEAGELGFWDWNIPSGEVQFGGEWTCMLGYTSDEIEPHVRGWERLVHPDDMPAVYATLQKHLDGKSPLYETEHRLRHKNGSWVWVLARGRVVERDPQGKAIRALGIHANISIERENRERLQEEDRRKDEFLATLAHELRNPLAPIRTGLAIIKRDPSGPAATHSLRTMERQLGHMVRLIDDLLDVSRITLGRLKLKYEDISIRSIVEMAVEASRPAIDAGLHTLTVNLPPQDVIITCDPTRLAQIISNLLTNSAKYTPDKGQISLSVEVTTEGFTISVSDNGLGIPRELQQKVFELFGQVNRTLDRSQGGLGIGLALVRNLVTLHGGTVQVSSPGMGKGSTFTITLPPSVLKTRLESETAAPLEPQEHPHRRVLIVDDNVDAAESLSMLAKLLGHTTDVALSGQEALQKVASFHPEVVFLDIGLPGMSGFEVAEAIKRSNLDPLPYVVAVTGWGSEETQRKAHAAGFDEHLTKPVEVSRLERILGAEGPLIV
jgi:PAS domain S-box-containing protein